MAESEADFILRCAAAHRKRVARFQPDVFPLRLKKRGKKNHSVNRERSRETAAREERGREKAAAVAARREHNCDVMRRYFAGELPDLRDLVTDDE